MKPTLLAVALLLLCGACQRNGVVDEKGEATVVSPAASGPDLSGKPTPGREEKSSPERRAQLDELVQGNNQFAMDLYKQLAKKEGNLVFSPYSISSALAMTYAGARGQTADEMARTLHFTLGQNRLHPAFATLMRPGSRHATTALESISR